MPSLLVLFGKFLTSLNPNLLNDNNHELIQINADYWDKLFDNFLKFIYFYLNNTKGKPLMSEFILNIKIEPLKEGGYLATSKDFPDLLAQGRTVAETMEIAQDVARKLVESYLEHGDILPEALKAARADNVVIEAKIPVSIAA